MERAAIFYGLFKGMTQAEIYQIAFDKANPATAATAASGWRRSEKIRDAWSQIEQEVKLYKEARQREINFQFGEEGGNEGAKLKNLVDFTDKAQFIKYLNTAANRITDDKLKNEVLKMLSDHLDYKNESKRGEAEQMQRFYLPVRCQDCEIYKAESQRLAGVQ